eukprot:CAMPEP_0115848234 /NCGR_PEP_ID=MMETSP0287-20121206/10811_1 /TAXON_ID=412157 /ORGANISM="Chrysochromulina rotalis, Strain UIO044" /LENGTH=54 /DNA_ID=CAMNT_0003302129 /DNA_START=72 /DNA_END=236 /DNA_ORIENTATION=-
MFAPGAGLVVGADHTYRQGEIEGSTYRQPVRYGRTSVYAAEAGAQERQYTQKPV